MLFISKNVFCCVREEISDDLFDSRLKETISLFQQGDYSALGKFEHLLNHANTHFSKSIARRKLVIETICTLIENERSEVCLRSACIKLVLRFVQDEVRKRDLIYWIE